MDKQTEQAKFYYVSAKFFTAEVETVAQYLRDSGMKKAELYRRAVLEYIRARKSRRAG